MTEAEPDRHRTDRAPTGSTATAGRKPTILEQLGGPMGFVYSTLPVVVFVVGQAFLPLPLTVGFSVAAALGITGFRLLRGEPFGSAVGGLVGVAVAAGVVVWTGSAADFFLIGIWASLAGFVVALGSVLARRPLSGLVWNAVHGGGHAWRDDRRTLRAHDAATIAAAAVFGARFVVQQWLYSVDATGGLAVAKIGMGMPLTVLAALVVVWAFRRSSARFPAAR